MHELELPSGLIITFRAPKIKDRRLVLKEFDRDEGLTPEDILSLYCLEKVDGKPLAKGWDAQTPLEVIDDWSLKDQQYYLEVFGNLYFLDDKGKEAASEMAKKLMSGGDTTTTPAKTKA